MKTRLLICLTMFAILIGFQAAAVSIESQFDAANRLYAENKFTEAAAAYESIINSGTISPALYFNLGNARFKAGQLGHAITAYQKTRTLTPRDPDLVANLKFARNQVQGPTTKPTAISNFFSALTLDEWTYLAAVNAWILFALLITRQIKPALRPSLKNWILISTGVTVLVCTALAITYSQNSGNTKAIVIVKDATVRNSPLEQAPSSFVAQDGAELRVLDTKDAWIQVTDGTRRIGWVKSDSVSIIGN